MHEIARNVALCAILSFANSQPESCVLFFGTETKSNRNFVTRIDSRPWWAFCKLVQHATRMSALQAGLEGKAVRLIDPEAVRVGAAMCTIVFTLRLFASLCHVTSHGRFSLKVEGSRFEGPSRSILWVILFFFNLQIQCISKQKLSEEQLCCN